MRLLISDANILIDFDVAGLLDQVFSLNYRYGTPDVLYYEELEAQHAHFLNQKLEIMPLNAGMVQQVVALTKRYPPCSRNDLFALVLAKHEKCILLTGDKALKKVAENEKLEVHGTLWLLEEIIKSNRLDPDITRQAIDRIKAAGRRLPWSALEHLVTLAQEQETRYVLENQAIMQQIKDSNKTFNARRSKRI